ncbi:MAG: hypothetical protein QM690_07455 [Sphingobium sp.]
MTTQIIPNLAYALLLVLALLAPYAAAGRTPPPIGRGVGHAILVLALGLIALRQGSMAPISIALLLPLVGRGMPMLLGGIAALLLFAPVIWWMEPSQVGPAASIAFLLLTLGAAALLRWEGGARATGDRRSVLIPFIGCALAGLAAGLLTTPLGSPETAYIAWHHWGAYLAPVEAWLAGGVPYRDFPVQYGLGPTTLLAAVCGQDCWRGMYGVAIAANALYFATLGSGALILTARLSHGIRAVALAAMFCATFLWTGFPSDLAGPSMTPSVAGLRFLTISALLFHIILAEHRGVRRDWIGHLLWLADLFWSPEAAFFGTLIWWPYLALRDAGSATRPIDALAALGRGALRGVAALATGGVLLAILLWLLSHRALEAADFLAYIQHPPGPLPVNPVGTVWLALAAIVLVIHAVAGLKPSPEGRSLNACLLGLLAAGSYYLSRSHDNNILNLFPLLLLMLLALLAVIERGGLPRPEFTRGFILTATAAMIAYVATFNYERWAEGAARDGPLTIGPTRLLARFEAKQTGEAPKLSPDAIRGLQYLRGRGAASVLLLDHRWIMPRTGAGTGWTGVNNGANFVPLPDDLVVRYIERGAHAYARPGWLMLDSAHQAHWLDLFRTAYDVREERAFGAYRAYYLVPRADRQATGR